LLAVSLAIRDPGHALPDTFTVAESILKPVEWGAEFYRKMRTEKEMGSTDKNLLPPACLSV